MAAPVIERMTVEAFLAWESAQEQRYELVDGVPMMMTGGTVAHDGVRGGVYSEFRRQLRGKPCRAHLDLKVACHNGNIRYPDAMIDCGSSSPKDLAASKPTVVVEVLSPSTKATDFLVKVADYESVPSIAVYAIFWQDEPRAVIYRRTGAKLVPVDDLTGLEGTIAFPEVGVHLDMAAIYEDVFVADPPPAG